jgi:hypothetical protein
MNIKFVHVIICLSLLGVGYFCAEYEVMLPTNVKMIYSGSIFPKQHTVWGKIVRKSEAHEFWFNIYYKGVTFVSNYNFRADVFRCIEKTVKNSTSEWVVDFSEVIDFDSNFFRRTMDDRAIYVGNVRENSGKYDYNVSFTILSPVFFKFIFSDNQNGLIFLRELDKGVEKSKHLNIKAKYYYIISLFSPVIIYLICLIFIKFFKIKFS